MSHGDVPGPARIVVVGFMAAGKSTVGALLAERLGWGFVDFDDRIRERTGRTAGELIRDRGEAAFRELEAAVTDELAGAEGVVLAPGGGWASRPELLDRLGPRSIRVWLRVSPDEALRRARADRVDRPLLGAPEGRRERVTELLESRVPHYARAEIVVDVDGREPEVVVEEILRRLVLEREDHERQQGSGDRRVTGEG